MKRTDLINHIGRQYLASNIENDEFNYLKALKEIGKDSSQYLSQNALRQYRDVDLRFSNDKISLIIETKTKLIKRNEKNDLEQLNQYVLYEKELTGNKVIAILAATETDEIRVWLNPETELNKDNQAKTERVIRTFQEYFDLLYATKNDKYTVVQNTYSLNELLHSYGINEKIRSQFVGTCLLSLKNGLIYENLTSKQIRAGIEGILTNLLEKDLNKATKLTILKNKVIDSQDIRELKDKEFQHVVRVINQDILPYINDKSSMGQDLLNLFFTTFNKYVGKSDKNQAFTPDHIVHFMCKVVNVNRTSIVLDPCCGSGAFLVRAMTECLADCDSEKDKEKVRKKQIFGIEYEETAFGLSTTNMLIHGDGNSNIIQGNCFKMNNFEDAGINVVLMNPPYNAQKKHCHPDYVKTWNSSTKEDPSKGFHFVYEIAEKVKKGKLAVLLPMQCAIGYDADIKLYKRKMLEKHTLDAVFSLPTDMFHPGANAIACCMIFNLGTRHEKAPNSETFFGYFKDDGFVKKKNLGRIEKVDKTGKGIWEKIEAEWLSLYRNRSTMKGKSITKVVNADDEWLAEAYMETDYSKLNPDEFQKVLNQYLGYLISNGRLLP
ncbi:SAM-dependent methyltransferase [Leptospira bandrabouensis]|uniref:HsdM family class I SAM-dependent methyltransferase n=1 Tax=Leptospira bandrabouensis TaxID=2484903 RepID=UPI00223D8987|nr:N-6 DNA methylase [Leptospira bandrabouensis]MCW7460412.1 SAM-dependent methyltransferase [Leptospira bandrabouensis]MCW7479398.1 SAM-dependent methyltransferase [Leptospira bandrabouensis]MCW7487085.1 SAM-dependent methyltransferase [Leptospira bandrabouensis]